MDLCASENEDHEHGMGAGVSTTLLSDTLRSIGLVECDITECVTRVKVWFRENHMDRCVCESEEHDHWVGDGVNTSLLSYTLLSIGLEESTGMAKFRL